MTTETEKKMIEEPKWHHRTYDIVFEPRNGRFHIMGDDVQEPWCDSLAEAMGKIDAFHAAAAKAKKVKFALEVYEPDGTEATITGIHAGHGNVTGAKGGGTFENYVYPRVPWVKATIHQINKLKREMSTLQHQLNCVQIRTKRHPGYGKIDPDDIPAMAQKLIADHKAATKSAEKMPVEA